MALEPGSQVGRYRILSIIGSGGMGQVYTALDPALDRPVALKVLSEALGGDPDFRERFFREAKAVGRLNHPHIVQVYDIGEEARVLWIAMQLVDGGSLRDRIQEGPMPLDTVETVLRQLASALDYAHGIGLVHRDVKPDNVLLTRDASAVRLGDFGIVKGIDRRSELTQTGAFIGTPKYSAPEAILGRDVDRRADIYSLGIVAYEMLTGRTPFSGGATEVIAAHLRDAPPSPRDARPEVPSALAAAVLRALEKEPDARFASAGQFVDVAFGDRSSTGRPAHRPTARRGFLERVWDAFRWQADETRAPAERADRAVGAPASTPRPVSAPAPSGGRRR
jgi:serine/threonine-protein kinase